MKRLILAAFLLAMPAFGQSYGRLNFQLQTAQGQAVSGATIYVYSETACGSAAGAQAQLYSSATGGPIGQPLYTNGLGQQSAYAAPGCVTVVYNSPYTGQLTYPDQLVTLPSSVLASSVSNSDGSLTISPTTGAVVASLNTANANTWTAQQTFLDGASFVVPSPDNPSSSMTNNQVFLTNGAAVSPSTITLAYSGLASNSGSTDECWNTLGGQTLCGVTSFAAPSGSWPSWLTPTVTNPTTTPSLAVAASAIPNAALAVQTANTVLGALTATTPSGLAMPSCSATEDALNWTSGTGFGCGTTFGSGSSYLPPAYETAAANATDSSSSVGVTLSTQAGDLIIVLTTDLNCISCGVEYAPISDTQGLAWTVDQQAPFAYFVQSNGVTAFHATAASTGSITITATGTSGNAIWLTAVDFRGGVGINATAIAGGGDTIGSLAPSVAASVNNATAFVLAEAPNAGSGSIVFTPPGNQIFSLSSDRIAGSLFQASGAGALTTSTATFATTNFPAAELVVFGNALPFGNMSNPMYQTGQLVQGGAVANGTASPTALTPGLAGTVLTSNGPNSLLTWTSIYPGAGVASSTGSAWGASYAVGTSSGDLVQLNASAQLPAVSGVNLTALPTNTALYPTLNQNTTGTAGSVANALTMNNSGSGAASGTTFNGSAAETISYNTIGASPLAGSTSLTTLGTVTTGTWNATAISPAYGGTGANNSSATGVSQWSSGTQSVSTALANGTTATTQAAGDASTDVATDAFVQQATVVPAWLQMLGPGTDGAETCNGNLSGEFYYTTFNVPLGDTCTITSGNGLTIHATGACTINGTIIGQASNSYPVGGGGAGGSGGGTAAATGSSATYFIPSTSAGVVSTVGTAGAASGGNGGNAGASTATSYQRQIFDSGAGSDGQFCGGGKSGAGGSSGGASALGGSGLTLICGSITGTGTINVSGANGNNAPGNNTGASAGGGGGVVILSSQAAETFALTINVAAGSPGSCLSYTGCGTPGTSAAGWYMEVSGW